MKDTAVEIIATMRHPVLALDRDLSVVLANRAFCETFEVHAEETVGRLVYELGNCQWDIPRLRELLEHVLPENNAFDDFEVQHDFEEIGHRIMMLNARRIDHVQLILLAIEDVTERRKWERELRASEKRLRDVLETDAVGVVFFDERGTLTNANDVFLRMTGRTREEVESCSLSWRSMTPPEWVEESERQIIRLRHTGRIGPYEKQYYLKDGSRSWMLFAGRRLDDGTVVEFCIDTEGRKLAEEEGKLLLRELSHRVNNTLAVVQALAIQTAKSAETIEVFRDAFLGRLAALTRAHQALLNGRAQTADLRELAKQAIEAYRVDHSDSVAIEGDSVALTAKQALGLSLILHELGTNATKYGALTRQDGHLRVWWDIDRAKEGRQLRLTWQERRGPPVEPPRKKGFGTQLIERACTYELAGEARLDYAPEGVTCQITFPLSQKPKNRQKAVLRG